MADFFTEQTAEYESGARTSSPRPFPAQNYEPNREKTQCGDGGNSRVTVGNFVNLVGILAAG
jgi:hypothetical protein